VRRRRTRLTPIESRVAAVRYRDGDPLKLICHDMNCVERTVRRAARLAGVPLRRPRKGDNPRQINT